MSAKLGKILVRENLVTPQQLREALDYQRTSGGRLGSNLVKLGIISDDVITSVLSRQYGVPSINIDLFQIEEDVIKLISQEVALKYTVLPISKVGATMTLAMADPTNVFAIDDIKFMTGLNVEPVIASEASIQMAIGKYYSGSTQIDIFEAAMAFDADRASGKNGKNGRSFSLPNWRKVRRAVWLTNPNRATSSSRPMPNVARPGCNRLCMVCAHGAI